MINVKRYSYFKGPRGENIRFTEHSPHVQAHDHAVCDCTKNVAERPKGTPKQVVQEIIFIHEPIGELRPTFTLCDQWLTFFWGAEPERTESGMIMASTPYSHANFRFRHHGERSVEIAIVPSDVGTIERISDAFFANLFVGNRIDISTLMNGHSPSRIVDLSAIKDTDVWVHKCFFGDEAMRVFADGEETRTWQRVMADMELIESRVDLYRKDSSDPIAELHQRIEKDALLLDTTSSVIETLAPIVEQAKAHPIPAALDHTELFRLGNEVKRSVFPKKEKSHGQQEAS